MEHATRGLVLRDVNYKESDKILTVLTEDLGKITVSARGARKPKGAYTASSQLLAFSELILQQRQGRYYLREGRVVELFSGLRQDVVLLSIGAYFAELLDSLSDSDVLEDSLLSLGLNALHILASNKKNPALIKASFELKLMCQAGYTPQLAHCIFCKTPKPKQAKFHLQAGGIHCENCHPPISGQSILLDPACLLALEHIVSADHKRIYAFTLGENSLNQLAYVSEHFVLTQLERNFKTLDFLKQFMKGN